MHSGRKLKHKNVSNFSGFSEGYQMLHVLSATKVYGPQEETKKFICGATLHFEHTLWVWVIFHPPKIIRTREASPDLQ